MPGPDWSHIQRTPAYRRLIGAKRRFIVSASAFFLLYYFALPVSVGFFPGVMEQPVIGRVNLAYLFALSQFFMAWTIAFLYVRQASRFDALAARIRRRSSGGRR